MAVADAIIADIAARALKPGDRLHPERTLCEHLGVARPTLRQAILRLEGEGVIYRTRRGKRGWFVAPPPLRYDPTRHLNLMHNALSQGRKPETLLLDRERERANPQDSLLFGVVKGTALYRVSSVVMLDGMRVCIDHNLLLAEAFPGFLDVPFVSPVTTLIQKQYGVSVEQTGFRVRSARLSIAEARTLDVSADTPGLNITRIKHHAGRVVHVDRETWIASAIEFTVGDIPT